MTIQKLYLKTKGLTHRCPIANLWLISLFFLSACSSTVYNTLERTAHKPVNWDKPPLQLTENQSKLYKMELTVYGNYFSGMMLFKAMPDSSIRVNLVSEAGFKLFDFELKNNQFKTISVFEQLNKKVLINTLENDLKMLLLIPDTNNEVLFNDKANSQTIIKTRSKTKPQFYFYTYPQDTLTGIKSFVGNKAKVGLQFKYNNSNQPTEITIKHENIKLEILLHILNQTIDK